MTLSTHLHTVDTATVTGTIVFAGAATLDETIVIVDAAGTSKTYTAKNSSSTTDLEFIKTNAAAAATALAACIIHANGHNGSITVADDTSGTLTLTLLVDGTYRFKNKASIVEGLSNTTVTQFGSAAGVEDKDGHTILNGGNIASAKGNSKSLIDIVAGRKVVGSQLVINTGTAHESGTSKANSSGTFGYNPSSSVAKGAINFAASAPDSGFIIRSGVVNKIAGTAVNPILSGGSDTTSRRGGTLPPSIHKYRQSGTWATTIFDVYGGNLLQSDGTAKAGITNRGSTVSLAADHAAQPTRAIPGEMTLLFDFVTFTNNNLDYSAITGA